MGDIGNLARRRNALRKQVLAWMHSEGMEGRLRQNSDAPMWKAYCDAERDLSDALFTFGDDVEPER